MGGLENQEQTHLGCEILGAAMRAWVNFYIMNYYLTSPQWPVILLLNAVSSQNQKEGWPWTA